MINSYRKDFWSLQPEGVQIWSEKGTVRGTLQPVLDEFAVGFQVVHGYGSATAIHDAAKDAQDHDRPLVILYVGDHDASGMHMSEIDLPERLERYGGNVEVVRIALTTDQDANGRLPSFGVEEKSKDPRYAWYKENYGNRCWELDAMSPPVLRDRARQALLDLIDQSVWEHCAAVEKAELKSVAGFRWG